MLLENTKWQQFALLLAWLIALGATLITLYLSIALEWSVCPLCWYQRIGLYPLSLLLAIAVYRDDSQIYIYAIPLAIIAAFFGLYQYLQQMIPGFAPIHFCTAGAGSEDCSAITWQLFGFITLPLLSFICSIVIIGLLWLSKNKSTHPVLPPASAAG